MVAERVDWPAAFSASRTCQLGVDGRLCAGNTAQGMYWQAGKHCENEPPAFCSPYWYRRRGNTARFDSLVRLQRRLCQAPSRPQGSPRTTGKRDKRGTCSAQRKITGWPCCSLRIGCKEVPAVVWPAACQISPSRRKMDFAQVDGIFSICHAHANWVKWGAPGSVAKISPSSCTRYVSFAGARTGNGAIPCYRVILWSFVLHLVFFLRYVVSASSVPGVFRPRLAESDSTEQTDLMARLGW